MAEKGWIRKELADHASVSDGVIGKVLAGKSVHNNTLIKIARVLGIDIDGMTSPLQFSEGHQDQADEAHGAYLRSEVEELIGRYLGYRRTFDGGRDLFRTMYEFHWSAENSRLQFIETQRVRRPDKTVVVAHAGGIHLSRRFGLVQLLTRYQGALRLVTLHRPQLGDSDLRGVMLTQAERKANAGPSYYVPGISPLYLQRCADPAVALDLEKLCGIVPKGEPDFDKASAELKSIDEHYVAGLAQACRPSSELAEHQ